MRVFKRLPTAIAALGLLAISSGVVHAQGGIAKGYSDIAGVLGIGGIGEASIALGGRYEKAADWQSFVVERKHRLCKLQYFCALVTDFAAMMKRWWE